MKYIYLLLIFPLLFCGCDKKDVSYGWGAPELSIILNDFSGQNLMPFSTDNLVETLRLEHEVTYEANGTQYIADKENSINSRLLVSKLDYISGNPIALNPLPNDFGYKLIEVAKSTSSYKCHAKVSLKCPDIFRDKNEHIIEMDLEYCGDKRYEILQVVKGTLQVDGITAECIDYKVYKINLNIK